MLFNNNSIVWVDPINRDPQFLGLISEVISWFCKIHVISTQRPPISLDIATNFSPFFSEVSKLKVGKVGLSDKVNLVLKFNKSFRQIESRLRPEDILFYSTGMSFPELESAGINRLKRKVSKLTMIVHQYEQPHVHFSQITKWRNSRLIKKFDGWIFLSEYIRVKAILTFGLPREKTYLMLHPHFYPLLKDIEVDHTFYSELKTFSKGRTLISYISRLDEDHGIDIFYSLISGLISRGLPVCGIVLGRISPLWSDAKNQVCLNSSGLTTEQIHLKTGTYSYSELRALLNITDFVFAPYRRISQSGAIALALGENVPVVASQTGANVEMVREGINGCLFDVSDISDITQRISNIYLSKSTMREQYPVTEKFNGHLDPYINVSNMLKWLKTI